MFFHGRTIYGIRTQTINNENGSTFIYQLLRPRSTTKGTKASDPAQDYALSNHPGIKMWMDTANGIFVDIPARGSFDTQNPSLEFFPFKQTP